MEIKISIIICSYNREKYIAEAILSLINQDFDAQDFEIVVVDNNSKDNTTQVCKDIIEKHPLFNIYYFIEKEQGSSFARNTGAIHAKGELLCFMDDDAIAEKDFLKNIRSFYKNHPTVEGFGGRIIPRYIPSEPKWMSHYVSSLVGNFHYANEVREFSSNKYPLESNMIVTKKAFNEVGGFNVQLPGVIGTLRIGGEGKDFFLRLKAKGHKIFYAPDVIVHHVVETNKLTNEYMYRIASGIGRGERQRIGKGFMPFIKKLLEYIYKLGGSFVIGIYYLITGTPAKSWPVIQFRIDVLKGFLGN